MSRIISYRGKLADDAQDLIPLHTNDGKTGYKVIKFELLPANPGTESYENVVKIYKIAQTANTGTIDFSDLTLVGAAYLSGSTSAINPEDLSVIFDNEVFNQDIYVTHQDNAGTQPVNYYIELEQVNLTEDQALVAIVKNLRNEQ
jgi:hypothetical protein